MKPLIIITCDDTMKELNNRLEEGAEQFRQALEFIEKQKNSSWEKHVGSVWDDIKEELKKRGLIHEDCDNAKLHIENDVIYLVEEGDRKKGLQDFIMKLISSKPSKD